MVALKGESIERYVERGDPRQPIAFVYGPDTGLVSERVRAILARLVKNPDDPFELVRLAGDDIAADPARLFDEVDTPGLFGGRRTVWVRAGSKSFAAALEGIAKAPPADTAIVVEAGDLAKKSPLRAAADRAPAIAAIPCYVEDREGVMRLIEGAVRAAGKSIEPAAKRAFAELIGADRLASRSEIEKLILYAGETQVIGPADVEACIGEASATAVEAAIDAAFAGDMPGCLHAAVKLGAEGQDANAILGRSLAHAWLLARGVGAVAGGAQASRIAETSIPFFKRRAAFERQLRLWTPERIGGAVVGLGEAVLAVRKRADLGSVIAERALVEIARMAAGPR